MTRRDCRKHPCFWWISNQTDRGALRTSEVLILLTMQHWHSWHFPLWPVGRTSSDSVRRLKLEVWVWTNCPFGLEWLHRSLSPPFRSLSNGRSSSTRNVGMVVVDFDSGNSVTGLIKSPGNRRKVSLSTCFSHQGPPSIILVSSSED